MYYISEGINPEAQLKAAGIEVAKGKKVAIIWPDDSMEVLQ